MSDDVNAKAASPEVMEQWGMVSIRASELASLRAVLAAARNRAERLEQENLVVLAENDEKVAQLAAALERETQLVEALESMTRRSETDRGVFLISHDSNDPDFMFHGEGERSKDGRECPICALLRSRGGGGE